MLKGGAGFRSSRVSGERQCHCQASKDGVDRHAYAKSCPIATLYHDVSKEGAFDTYLSGSAAYLSPCPALLECNTACPLRGTIQISQ